MTTKQELLAEIDALRAKIYNYAYSELNEMRIAVTKALGMNVAGAIPDDATIIKELNKRLGKTDSPEFHWSTVKQGMSFVRDGVIYFYIGEHLKDKRFCYVCEKDVASNLYTAEKASLTRAPEHDKVV